MQPKTDACLGMMRAARRKLRDNASIDTAVDDTRVSFRVCETGPDGARTVTDFYVPDIFHLCWTMREHFYADVCLHDVLRSRRVSEVYLNAGFKADRENVRMLGNWPLRNVRLVGKVVSCEQREQRWMVLIDDGSCDSGCIEVLVDRYVWAMMEVEGACFGVHAGWCVCVYGTVGRVGGAGGFGGPSAGGLVTVRADRVSVVAKRGGELLPQLEWWASVLQTRAALARPWRVDMSSQDALAALRSLEAAAGAGGEKSSPAPSPPPALPSPPPVEVIDLDAEERELEVLPAGRGRGRRAVPLAEWAAATFSRPLGVRVGTAEQLELAVLRTLVRETLAGAVAVAGERVYGTYAVALVLNGLVLGVFLESSVGLADDALVERRWRETRFRESKQFLLRCVFERLAKQGAVEQDGGDGGDGTVGLRGLAAALVRVRAVFFSAAAAPAGVPMQAVRAALWPGAGRVAALAVVGELAVGTGAEDLPGGAWMFDCAGDCWVRERG